jgi:mannose-1-phosphate guanylyltransferase
LNLHYRPETITALVGDGAALGVRVRYSWEAPLLGSGGGPRRAFSLVPDDRLWLVNGDTLTDVDLGALSREHAAGDALVTMALIPNPAPARYGGVLVDEDGSVRAFVPRGSTDPTWHFVGIQIAERAAFASLDDGVPAESVGRLYRSLIAARPGAVRAFRCDAQFIDIGTPREYLDACLSLAGTAIVRGERVRVAEGATLHDCVLLDGATVEAGAVLRRVVLGEGVTVPSGFSASDSVLMPGLGGGSPEVTRFL